MARLRDATAAFAVVLAAAALAAHTALAVPTAANLLADPASAPKYEIIFDPQPVHGGQQQQQQANCGWVRLRGWGPTQAGEMLVTAPSGKRYVCHLPETAPTEDSTKTDPDAAKTAQSPKALLEPMGDYCLYRPAGWWIYEFCHGHHVKQFHEDLEKKTPRVQYMLGHAVTSATSAFDSDGVDATGNRYYREWYTDGTICDLTGLPRRTEVRFTCDLLKPEQFSDIKETSTCQYQVLVTTPRICAHPLFRPRDGAAMPIKCQLVLDDDAWEAYRKQPTSVVHTPPLDHATYRTYDGVVGLKFTESAPAPAAAAPAKAKADKADPAATAAAAGAPAAKAKDEPPAAKAKGKDDADAEDDAAQLQLTESMLDRDLTGLRAMLIQLRRMALAAQARQGNQHNDEHDELAFEDGFVVRLGDSRWSYRIVGDDSPNDEPSDDEAASNPGRRDGRKATPAAPAAAAAAAGGAAGPM